MYKKNGRERVEESSEKDDAESKDMYEWGKM